jgi:hypothetical protein
MTKNEYKMSKDIAYIPPAHKVAGIMSGKQSLLIGIIKKQPDSYAREIVPNDDYKGFDFAARFQLMGPLKDQKRYQITNLYNSPFGQPRDRLYIREAFYENGHWRTPPGPDGTIEDSWWVGNNRYKYNADGCNGLLVAKNNGYGKLGWRKYSSACMPKKAARTWLEVVTVTAKRIQDITEQEAIAAGVQFITAENKDRYYRHYMADNADLGLKDRHYSIQNNPIASFRTLWDKHHPGSWERNDWVWMAAIKVLSTTGKPAL